MAIHGETPVSFLAVTEPDWRFVKDNLYRGKVTKRSLVYGTVNRDYAATMNEARVAKGFPADFVAKPRPWGERLEGTCVIEHKGESYLEVFVDNALTVYLDQAGLVVSHELLEPWLRPRAASDGVVVRCYKLANVSAFVVFSV